MICLRTISGNLVIILNIYLNRLCKEIYINLYNLKG